MGTRTANRAARRGSRTAELVALSRARHLMRHQQPYVFEDRLARRFLGPVWRTVLDNGPLDTFVSRVLLKTLMPVTTQHLVRSRFAEDCLEAAVRRGVSQYVLLGAGYDTFAFRRPSTGLGVFEVDLPASLDRKMKRMKAARLTVPANVRHVGVDLETGPLAGKLEAAGYDRSKPAFFNWMGVTYYLRGGTIRRTLDAIAAIAAEGSELVFDYLIDDASVAQGDRALFSELMAFVERRGEPMISRFDPAGLAAALHLDPEWTVVTDDPPAAQAERYLGGQTDVPPLAPIANLVLLRRCRAH